MHVTDDTGTHTDAADGDGWVQRVDRGQLLRPVARPDGTLLVEGIAAREGVLEYRNPDGSIRRELVRADTLARSARTLARAPVTLGHPREDVTPSNVARYGVGDVDGEVIIEDGGFVRVKMAIRREDAIKAVRQQGVEELSAGYQVRLDHTPGVHPVYGPYDAEQVERVHNHLALVEAARAGHEARVRVDGAVLASVIERRSDADNNRRAGMNPRLVALLSAIGITSRFDSDDAGIEAGIEALGRRKDADERKDAELAEVRADRDREKARADALAEELSQVRAEAERAGLEQLATDLQVDAAKFPTVKRDGKYSNLDLKRALVAAHLGEDPRTDASEEYLHGVLDQAKKARRDADSGRAAGADAWAAPPQRADGRGAGPPPAAQARKGPSQLARERYDAAFQSARKGGGDR